MADRRRRRACGATSGARPAHGCASRTKGGQQGDVERAARQASPAGEERGEAGANRAAGLAACQACCCRGRCSSRSGAPVKGGQQCRRRLGDLLSLRHLRYLRHLRHLRHLRINSRESTSMRAMGTSHLSWRLAALRLDRAGCAAWPSHRFTTFTAWHERHALQHKREAV